MFSKCGFQIPSPQEQSLCETHQANSNHHTCSSITSNSFKSGFTGNGTGNRWACEGADGHNCHEHSYAHADIVECVAHFHKRIWEQGQICTGAETKLVVKDSTKMREMGLNTPVNNRDPDKSWLSVSEWPRISQDTRHSCKGDHDVQRAYFVTESSSTKSSKERAWIGYSDKVECEFPGNSDRSGSCTDVGQH